MFDFEKPNEIALVTSLATAFFVFVCLLFLYSLGEAQIDYLAILLVPIAVFGFSFLIVRFAVSNFLHRKIQLIYKNIQDQKLNLNFGRKNTPDLDDVNEEVQAWANKKMKEIAKLKVREKYRKEFIGNVSHELKTPIFNIQGYILTLLEGALEDEEINREYLNRANRSVERMIRLVEDLEFISKLEEGRMELDISTFDIVEETKDLMEALNFKSKKLNVDVRMTTGSDKSYRVKADQTKVRQVLTNLITNAINYSEPERDSYVEIRFHNMEKKVLVEVSDNGVGIPKRDARRVFERFYRVDKSRSRDKGGTGLGLAIVKHIIEAHNENINLASSEGFGSTFSFTLKQVK